MGGSAREWSTVLPSGLVAGGTFELRLVMTKFDAPAVSIAYEVRVEPR